MGFGAEGQAARRCLPSPGPCRLPSSAAPPPSWPGRCWWCCYWTCPPSSCGPWNDPHGCRGCFSQGEAQPSWLCLPPPIASLSSRGGEHTQTECSTRVRHLSAKTFSAEGGGAEGRRWSPSCFTAPTTLTHTLSFVWCFVSRKSLSYTFAHSFF